MPVATRMHNKAQQCTICPAKLPHEIGSGAVRDFRYPLAQLIDLLIRTVPNSSNVTREERHRGEKLGLDISDGIVIDGSADGPVL